VNAKIQKLSKLDNANCLPLILDTCKGV